MTTGPFTVVLQDLGQPNTNGVSPASVAVYTNGKLTNETAIAPGNANITKFNVSGQTLYLEVNQTFAGLYAYQKWAKIQAYSNIMNITSGHVFNQTNDPGWYTELLWTNTTSTGGTANAVALKSIVIYNTTPTSLNAGQVVLVHTEPISVQADIRRQHSGIIELRSCDGDKLIPGLNTVPEPWCTGS
jgi:hypothetical protein